MLFFTETHICFARKGSESSGSHYAAVKALLDFG
jgi:hypothetical protein